MKTISLRKLESCIKKLSVYYSLQNRGWASQYGVANDLYDRILNMLFDKAYDEYGMVIWPYIHNLSGNHCQIMLNMDMWNCYNGKDREYDIVFGDLFRTSKDVWQFELNNRYYTPKEYNAEYDSITSAFLVFIKNALVPYCKDGHIPYNLSKK